VHFTSKVWARSDLCAGFLQIRLSHQRRGVIGWGSSCYCSKRFCERDWLQVFRHLDDLFPQTQENVNTGPLPIQRSTMPLVMLLAEWHLEEEMPMQIAWWPYRLRKLLFFSTIVIEVVDYSSGQARNSSPITSMKIIQIQHQLQFQGCFISLWQTHFGWLPSKIKK